MFTKSQIESMTVAQILNGAKVTMAVRETRWTNRVVVLRGDNKGTLRMLAVRINAILRQFVGGFSPYSTEPQPDKLGGFFVVVPLKGIHGDLPESVATRIVANLENKLGVKAIAEVSADVEPTVEVTTGCAVETEVTTEVAVTEGTEPVDVSTMTRAQLFEYLETRGVSFKKRMKVDELRQLAIA